MGANKIDLTKDTNTVYTHPSSIQCNASSEISNLKTSVSNGKSLIASAITGKGVSTASNATFQTMANNINSIQTGSANMIKVQADANGYFTIPPLGVAPQWVVLWQRRGTEESGRRYLAYIDFTCGRCASNFDNDYVKDSYIATSTFYDGESKSPITLTAEYMRNNSVYTLYRPNYYYENSMVWIIYQ